MISRKRFRVLHIIGFAAILLVCTTVCAHAIGYTIIDLGIISTEKPVSSGAGINSSGQVAGTVRNSSGSSLQSVLYADDRLLPVPVPEGYSGSYALGINDSRHIVGGLWNASSGLSRGYLYSDGTTVLLPAGTDISSDARAVSDSDIAVGVSYASDGKFRAIYWADTTPSLLPSPFSGGILSEANGIYGGFVAGSASDANGTFHAVRYGGFTTNVLGTPSGYWDSFGTAINSSGDIVGFASDNDSSTVVKWLAGSTAPVVIGNLNGHLHSAPSAINGSGWVVGTAWSSDFASRTAFVYDGSTIHSLTDLVPLGSGWTLRAANGINSQGQITGYGTVDGQNHAYLLTPITCGTVTGSKLAGDGTRVSLANASVTAVFGDSFYIEAFDRHVGIRVHGTKEGLAEDQEVSVIGSISTENGERFIEAETIVASGSRDLRPLGMSTGSLGGRNWFYEASTGAGQRGVKNGKGANTIGLLVRIWGKVSLSMPLAGIFYVDDGSLVDDGSGVKGICVSASDMMIPAKDDYVEVTGISSCTLSGTDAVNLLKPRYQADIRLLD